MMKSKAEELLKIVGHTTYKELKSTMDMVSEIYSTEIRKSKSVQWALSYVYQAGKIEGIRQERKKKKRVN